jgi:membrane peptidoglycan carboxypeptidase
LSKLSQSSEVVSEDGAVLGKIFDENRIIVNLELIPIHVQNAFIASEDKRFYRHRGIDPVALMRAVIHNVRALRLSEGGSTITQQLVRNVLLHDTKRSLWRKTREFFNAIRLERSFSKKQILEAYLNAIWFGHGVYGIYNASEYYYSIKPADLNLNQASTLAGLIRAPGKLSPVYNPARTRIRRDYVLRKMFENGYISKDTCQHTTLSDCPKLQLSNMCKNQDPGLVDYYLDSVRSQIRKEHPTLYPNHRLSIFGTLNRLCQTAIAKSASAFNATNTHRRLSATVIDVHSGNILGIANGHDYKFNKFNIAMRGQLQPGSTLKPFVLAAAMRKGISPDRTFMSEPIELKLNDDKIWQVRNYDEVYRGRISLADALAFSDNCVFARLANEIGLEPICDVLNSVGIQLYRPTLAVSLGALRRGVSPIAIARAYTVFSNEGLLLPITTYSSIAETESGRKTECHMDIQTVLDPGISREIDALLREVVQKGTASEINNNEDLRAKTGTTNQGSWLVSYNPFFQVTTWVEREQEQSPGIRLPKARNAIDLANRIWWFLCTKSFWSDYWSILHGYKNLSSNKKIEIDRKFMWGS